MHTVQLNAQQLQYFMDFRGHFVIYHDGLHEHNLFYTIRNEREYIETFFYSFLPTSLPVYIV